MKLHYKIENDGDREKPWFVLINGLFANLNSWDTSVAALTQSFRVLRYDCRGQGESPKPKGPYLLSQHTKDLLELLDQVQIEKAFLLGLSNGGRIALSFASQQPERVLSLAVADCYDNPSPLLEKKLKSWKEANRMGGPTHRFDIASPWVWGESIVHDNPHLLESYRKKSHLQENYVVEGLIDGALKENIDVTLIQNPTLILAGQEDVLTPPFTHSQLKEKISDSVFKLIKGGHASLLEYPQSIQEVILPFFQERL